MSVLRCKMCGGNVIPEQGSDAIGVCEYCGTRQTVAIDDNEKKINLFNRANRLRMAGEFDKAAVMYEGIVSEFPEEAESYWCLCLCNYGIEYVDDPATAEKKPTCHRASYESILDDENFKLALEYSDAYAQSIYRREAREIDRIQKDILALVKNEKPYDVFICYKETDDITKQRTVDSVLAQDIYEALTEKGFKVFFARITLEDKLGMQYEPYIFAALNSAKVMLAVGTKYEYYNAVWVKNEWSRFLKLAAKDKSKLLIPCFKGIDAYDMPEEFKMLQAQDMGKLGFIQDLVRGVKKIVSSSSAETVVKETVVVNGAETSVAPLLKRAFMYLEDKNWEQANEYCERVLDIDPENAEAYLGKLMAETRISKKTDLHEVKTPFDSLDNYKKFKRFASPEQQAETDSELKAIYDRIYNNADALRKEADELLKKADEKNDADKYQAASKKYSEAEKLFNSISNYSNAKDTACKCIGFSYFAMGKAYAAQCMTEFSWVDKDSLTSAERKKFVELSTAMAEKAKNAFNNEHCRKIFNIAPIIETIEEYIKRITEEIEVNENYLNAVALKESGTKESYCAAVEIFDSVITWRDAIILKEYCIKRANELNAAEEQERMEIERKQREARIASEKAEKRRKRIFAVITSIIAICVFFALFAETVIVPSKKYNSALALYNAGKYTEAIDAFAEMNGYKDSDEKIKECEASLYGEPYAQTKVGGIITLGSYEQDNDSSNGKETIDWIVLDKQNGKVLLISKYALDCQVYHSSYENTTWERCGLRNWLNDTFLNNAFSEDEQKQIATTTVSADKNPNYNTDPGSTTQDKIFLLSIDEANKYFSTDSERQCQGTAYCYAQGAYDDNGLCWWWLRSPGDHRDYAAPVGSDGSVGYSGDAVNFSICAVRPALWINLES